MNIDIKHRIMQIKNGEVPTEYITRGRNILPSQWEQEQLKNIISRLESGVSVNSYNKSCGIGEKGILKTSSVSSGKFYPDENKTIQPNEIQRAKLHPRKDSIIISRMNTPLLVGEVGYVEEDYNYLYVPDRLWQTVLKKNNCSKWLSYILTTSRIRFQIKGMATGTSNSMKNISKESFLSIDVPYPPLPEQQKIATILSTQDKIIELKEKLLVEKKRQKKYLMQVLLNPNSPYFKRLPRFSGEWEEKRLKSVFRERKSFCRKGEEYEHISLTTQGVVPKSVRYERDFLVRSEEKEYKITKYNDICYNPANLKFGVITRNTYGEGIFSPIYVTFEIREGYDIDFMGYFVDRWDFINKVRKYEQGTVYERMAVSPKDFLNFKIKLPSILEQKEIACLLSKIDQEIDKIENELRQQEQKKKALMQLLLTGKVRVKV